MGGLKKPECIGYEGSEGQMAFERKSGTFWGECALGSFCLETIPSPQLFPFYCACALPFSGLFLATRVFFVV